MTEFYTILLNGNEATFLIFQVPLKIVLNSLSPLIFYFMMVVLNPVHLQLKTVTYCLPHHNPESNFKPLVP